MSQTPPDVLAGSNRLGLVTSMRPLDLSPGSCHAKATRDPTRLRVCDRASAAPMHGRIVGADGGVRTPGVVQVLARRTARGDGSRARAVERGIDARRRQSRDEPDGASRLAVVSTRGGPTCGM